MINPPFTKLHKFFSEKLTLDTDKAQIPVLRQAFIFQQLSRDKKEKTSKQLKLKKTTHV